MPKKSNKIIVSKFSKNLFSSLQDNRHSDIPGYEGTFCSDRTLEHFEMFPGTFKKLLLKQKLQCYVVIGQKSQKLRGFLDWKFLGMYIILNPENLEKNWVQKLHGHGVYVYILLFENVPGNKIGTF